VQLTTDRFASNFLSTMSETLKMKLAKVRMWYFRHFQHNPIRDGALYLVMVALLFAYTLAALGAPMLVPSCDTPRPSRFPWGNPNYNDSPCQRMRYGVILGLTPMEASLARRMLTGVMLGAMIGYERRSPDRPAGVRTMSVTALGASCFTISSIFAFESSSMEWDASRVTAAIPSGVGFLGAGLIWKGFVGHGSDKVHHVNGLTTAASVWISAAVGVASGGGLYWPATFTTLAVVLILRFGPRSSDETDGSDKQEEHEASKVESRQAPIDEITPLLRPDVAEVLRRTELERAKTATTEATRSKRERSTLMTST